MQNLATNTAHSRRPTVLPQCPDARWYAAYTSANHEKRVATQLEERAVEHFLPLYESVRRWKDRRVKLQLPLFQGYVFVRMLLTDRLRVLQVPGVAQLVSFNGAPAVLPEEEIEMLRASLADGLGAKPHPYLTIGRRVRITAGALQGLEGILVQKKKRTRFVISLKLIQRSVAVEIDGSELELIARTSGSGK